MDMNRERSRPIVAKLKATVVLALLWGSQDWGRGGPWESAVFWVDVGTEENVPKDLET